jgi:hypothetical protein
MTPKRQTFFVKLARPRVDVAIVEVEATDDEDAEAKAMQKAKQLPAAAWNTQPFDANDYCPHVQNMIAEDELNGSGKPHEEAAAELNADEETYYLLLKANCATSEGDLMLQPWFTVDHPDLLASDLNRDWLSRLNGLGLTHMSERLDDLAGGSPPMPSDSILFGARNPKKSSS